MNYDVIEVLLIIFFWGLCGSLPGQSVIILDNCDQSYIDPQDANGNNQQTQDTLLYTENFPDQDQLREYIVDINAFGGQQVDRAWVYALLPDGSRKLMGKISFGNCVDCTQGFALILNDSLLVEEVSEQNTMNMWIQSLGQPDFALPGNLQTLNGVGRISGQLPVCATGMEVEFIVFSNPDNTTTEFSTHIFCPETVADCSILTDTGIDCEADSIYLSAFLPPSCFSAATTVEWSNAAGWSASTAQAGLPQSGNLGMYYLTVTDECCTIVDSFLIENPPFAEAGPDEVVCEGTSLSLNGSGGIDHYWELPGGEMIDSSLLVFDLVTADLDGAFILHAFNEEGCEDTDTLILSVQTPPQPLISLSEACLGDTLFFSVLNDTVYTQLSWLNPQQLTLGAPYVDNLAPGDFGTYTLVAVDAFGCEVRTPFEVDAAQLPAFEVAIEETCDTSRAYLFPEDFQYQWETGQEGPVFATATGGTFQVTVTDAEGCSAIEQVTLPVPDGPDFELDVEQPVCPGDLGRLRVDLADPDRPVIYSIDGGQTYRLNPDFKDLSPGDYQVIIQDELGCIQQRSLTILRPDTLGVELNIDYLEVRPLTPVSLSASTIGNVQAYQWLPRSIDTEEPATDFIATNDLDVRIIVRDDRGCHASDGFQLTIVLGDIYIPNSFSPDGNGINDGFTFYSDRGSGEIIERLRIFDRWGGFIFEAEEIELNDESSGWDGTFRGQRMNTGVYSYFGVVRFGNGVRKLFSGDVTLMGRGD